MNGTVSWKFCFCAIFASPNRYFTENSRWLPLSTLLRGVEEWNSLTKSRYDVTLFPLAQNPLLFYN